MRKQYWTNYGFYFLEGSVRWRFPIAFQSFFTILVMIGLFVLPDSPRWLASKGRMTEAKDIIARLRGKELDDPEVRMELQNIKESLEVQNLGNGFEMKELLTNGPSQNLRRTLLGVASQFFQQFTGINLVTVSQTHYHFARPLTICTVLRDIRIRELPWFRPRYVSSAGSGEWHRILHRGTMRPTSNRTTRSTKTHVELRIRYGS